MRKWADRFIKLQGLNTLRNQIFTSFTLLMILVLTFAGLFTYREVSVLLKESAQRHIQQTAIQANGRLDALLEQIDSLSTQVTMDIYVQNLLLKEVQGARTNFNERQSLLQVANNYMAYSSGISSLEIYTHDNRRLFPLDEPYLNRISDDVLAAANEQMGRIVWIGIESQSSDTVMAIRRINLMEKSFVPGGYLLAHINREYFNMNDSQLQGDLFGNKEFMILGDRDGNPIISDIDYDIAQSVLAQSGNTVMIDEEQMLAVRRQSDVTDWELVLLLPVEAATEGIAVLKMTIYVSIGIAALAFLLLTMLLSTMISRPLQRLMRSMRGAKVGELKVIDVDDDRYGSLEINELNNTYNQMVGHMNELIQVVYEKEITQSRTELKALQAQINPHFLYNTLEAFYWALIEKGESELAHMILAMSGLFRYVIGNVADKEEWVTIRDEIEHAKRYLKIMSMRLVDRLRWNIEVEDQLLKVSIPKLIIQPLVENAIQHGIEGRINRGSVKVQVFTSRPGFVTIKVSDDGPGMSEEMLKELLQNIELLGINPQSLQDVSGIAISNVQRRLKLYYPNMEEQYSGLHIESREGVGTTVSFEIAMLDEGGILL